MIGEWWNWLGALLIVLWGIVLASALMSIDTKVEKLSQIAKRQQETLETITDLLRQQDGTQETLETIADLLRHRFRR